MVMKTGIKILIIAVLAAFMHSCEEDFLDRTPQDQFSGETVWNDPGIARAFTSGFYRSLGDTEKYWGICSISDEAMFLHGYDAFYVQGKMTADNITNWPIKYSYSSKEPHGWQPWFKMIKRANTGFENLESYVEPQELYTNSKWKAVKGELHFFRAWNYFNLVRFYGGVPIIEKKFGLNDTSEVMVTRNTFKECVNFIQKDLDSARALLPSEPSELGRAYDAAAMALESRLWLYAASDLYNQADNTNPLVGYTDGNQRARWEKAQEAARAVMDLDKFSLYQPSSDPVETYHKLFVEKTHSGDILSRYYKSPEAGHWFQGNNNPPGWNGWGCNQPIQQMVDAYEWQDGTDFSWNQQPDTLDPYGLGKNGQVDANGNPLKRRDPRFYATILFDGAQFKPRPPELEQYDSEGIVDVGHGVNQAGDVVDPGVDSRKGPNAPWNGTRTGYYLGKFADHSIQTWEEQETTPYRVFRFAEILLNYAEASIELGEESKARDALNRIRSRVNMPAITASGQQLVEEYRQERRVELAFEDHRYYDIRRWMIDDQVMQDDAMGVTIYDHPDGSTTYKKVVAQDRTYPERYSFNPIPATELRRNPKLEQNPGY